MIENSLCKSVCGKECFERRTSAHIHPCVKISTRWLLTICAVYIHIYGNLRMRAEHAMNLFIS